MKSRALTVGTTAAQIATGGNVTIPESVLVQNPVGATATVYLGGSDVTTANGVAVIAGASISVDMVADSLWAVVGTGTQEIRTLERT
jgi:hypothetical protein